MTISFGRACLETANGAGKRISKSWDFEPAVKQALSEPVLF
jgi:hypothetical protein